MYLFNVNARIHTHTTHTDSLNEKSNTYLESKLLFKKEIATQN